MLQAVIIVFTHFVELEMLLTFNARALFDMDACTFPKVPEYFVLYLQFGLPSPHCSYVISCMFFSDYFHKHIL